jgi:hypothetical protein
MGRSQSFPRLRTVHFPFPRLRGKARMGAQHPKSGRRNLMVTTFIILCATPRLFGAGLRDSIPHANSLAPPPLPSPAGGGGEKYFGAADYNLVSSHCGDEPIAARALSLSLPPRAARFHFPSPAGGGRLGWGPVSSAPKIVSSTACVCSNTSLSQNRSTRNPDAAI